MRSLADLPALAIDPSRSFAVLADIHANLEAIEAVGAWLSRRGIAEAVVLGDLIGYGASPRETVEFVRERGWSAVRGNHEDMLLDMSHVEKTRSLKSAVRRALEWTRARLGSEVLDYFADLPLAARIGSDLIALHGSLVDPRHCYAYIYEFSLHLNAARLREIGCPEGTVVLFGHTHERALFEVDNAGGSALGTPDGRVRLRLGSRHFANPGSVGFPRDGDPRASFMLWDGTRRDLEWVRLEYDAPRAAQKIIEAGYGAALAERLLAAR